MRTGIVDGAPLRGLPSTWALPGALPRRRPPVEAHLLGFDGDLYGKDIRIEFEEWLRGPRVFETKDELIETVMGNIEWVREHLGGK